MDGLSETQRQAVQQLQEIIHGADEEVAVSVLGSVDWDVQRAADFIFGTSGTTLEVDDSQQGVPPHAPARPRNQPPLLLAFTRPLLSLVALPFHVLSSLFKFLFTLFRLPIPQIRFSGLNFYRPLRPRRPTGGGGNPDRWLRELEEETGAVSIGRARPPRGTTSSLNLNSSAGDPAPSNLTSRTSSSTGADDGRKYLPDFTTTTYEGMLRACEREAKIGCVVLVSDEHDDVAEFKRTTLTDSAFVRILYEHEIIVWGGDVRDRDAWAASEKLQATTYPFVAFLALQPRRSSTSSRTNTTSPVLTVLSRHQGSSTPSTSAPTSARVLVEHLEHQLLPRVTPFLTRLTLVQREREQERLMRAEQDRAFESAARRDKARIEAKMAQEQAEQEARKAAEQEARLADQRREKEAEEDRERERERMVWRRWARRLVSQEGATGKLRIAIRLPDGKRVVHPFLESASVTSLYAFVDSQFIPAEYPPSEDPAVVPNQRGSGEAALENKVSNYTHEYWGFRVATAYPRVEIPWTAKGRLSDIEQLKGGGQLVVEFFGGRTADNNEDEDDGYHTEDSE